MKTRKTTSVIPVYQSSYQSTNRYTGLPIVIPAQAGIHMLLILNADNKLDSGLRRNDEFKGHNDEFKGRNDEFMGKQWS